MKSQQLKAELCDKLASTLSDIRDECNIPSGMAEDVDDLLNEYSDILLEEMAEAVKKEEESLDAATD